MKTGDKVRIVKVCAPFIGIDLLGKVSKITIRNESIYLDDLKINCSKYWIEKVEDDATDIIIEKVEVYKPRVISIEEIKKESF
jgi:hypothetical protein